MAAEVSALTALQAIQGSDVPQLLQHGFTTEGFAYVLTEYIEVSSMACAPGQPQMCTPCTLQISSQRKALLAVSCAFTLSRIFVVWATQAMPTFSAAAHDGALSSLTG